MRRPAVEAHLVQCLEQSFVDPNAAGIAALEMLMAATGSQDGYYLIGTRLKGRPRLNASDRLFGFRVLHHQRVRPHSEEAGRLVREMVERSDYVTEPSAAVVVQKSKARSVWLVRARRGGGQYLRAPLSKAMEIHDELRAIFPLGGDAFVLLAVQRHRKKFAPHDCAWARALLPLLASALLRLGEHHGIFDGKCLLGPREVEVYRQLQTDKTEKQIAQALGLSTHTVHELVGAVFKKVGVTGRLGVWSRIAERARAGLPGSSA